jgi:hypothetical protein
MADVSFAIGIDLGTTHCSLSSIAPQNRPDRCVAESFPILQVIAPGESSPQALLPSFVYLAAEGEFATDAFALPWSNDTREVIGSFARSKGAMTPSRLVASAKSWLSHTKVDRHAPVLPWGAPDAVPKLSPVTASAHYLQHLREAWDAAHPEAPLVDQDVVLTVPASFDAVARELTLEAASLAGFPQALRLLEEPQAALYAWVAQSGGTWRDQVSVGDRILVIDIGGGTTDFSLISVEQRDGALELERVAVGNHILLGGDNMDLALAYTVRARLESEGKKLDDWQMVALTHSCRVAKEKLLSDEPPAACPLVIPGRSSRLIGGIITSELTAEQLNTVLLEGFLPRVAVDSRPQAPPRVGLTAMGLPYASDAAITRHLAAFLARAAKQDESTETPGGFPSKVLFNGGVTRSRAVRERLLDVLGTWAAAVGQAAPVALPGTDAELAVSRGAAYFARATRDSGLLRIRSATVQSHYIGIQRAELAVPGLPPRIDAVCVAPCGLEEGSRVSLEQTFGLVLGELVSFRFFSSATRDGDVLGSVVDPSELTELAPLETSLDADDRSAEEVVEVQLSASLSEIGTLEIAAVDIQSDRRWKLSFNVRVD